MVSSLHIVREFVIFVFLKHLRPPILITLDVLRQLFHPGITLHLGTDESLHLERWYDQMFYFVRAEMECYTNMLLLMQDIEEDEDWEPTIFDESEEEELIDDV